MSAFDDAKVPSIRHASLVVSGFALLTASLSSTACNAISGVNDYAVVPEDVPDSGAKDASAEADAPGSDSSDAQESSLNCDAGSGGIGVVGEPCCTGNELACAGHAQKLVLFCDPKAMVWVALQSCSGNQLCSTEAGINQGSCQDVVKVCMGMQPGDQVCDGDTQVICGPDLVTSTETPCPVVCVDGACSGQCTPGTQQCSALIPQTCDAQGLWIDGLPCAYLCLNSSCTGTCVPGATQCSGNVPQTCSSTGQWEDGTACPKVCVEGVCADACTTGISQCSGNTVQTCNDGGTWDDGASCPYLCISGSCVGECSPDTKRCDEKIPQSCDATGQWQSGNACPYVCSGGDCVGVCSPGSKECSGITPVLCDSSGNWQLGAECTYVCEAGECSGVCTPGAKQCAGQVPQTCNSFGQWESGPACPMVCTAGTCTVGCTPGTTQCNGIELQTCADDRKWVSGTTCQYVCVSGACTGVCTPGTKDCDGLVPRSCDAMGQWQSGSACPYLCNGGACEGVCLPGSKGCSGSVPQTCQSDATWLAETACSDPTPICQGGTCVAYGPSCQGLAENCGPGGSEACCSVAPVPGGTFFRSYDAVNYASKSFPATVSAFSPDVYEISVGRFRKFVAGYPNNRPTAGAGKNPNNAQDPGWNTSWHSLMPSTQAGLIDGIKCHPNKRTWTDTPGGNEAFPMTCITWYEAFAFCIWDGGRLPSEAEWNYVAAGGGAADGQRVFAWSSPSTSTTIDNTFAVFCGSSCAPKAVGSRSPKGNGKWGHADLTGNVWEWTVDVFADLYPSPCSDCANFTGDGANRTIRGGSFDNGLPPGDPGLYVGYRDGRPGTERKWNYGARCVRSQ